MFQLGAGVEGAELAHGARVAVLIACAYGPTPAGAPPCPRNTATRFSYLNTPQLFHDFLNFEWCDLQGQRRCHPCMLEAESMHGRQRHITQAPIKLLMFMRARNQMHRDSNTQIANFTGARELL